MKIITRSMLVSLFVIFAGPVFADEDMQVIQIYNCEFNGDATSADILDVSAQWLKAAKKTKGGENLELGIRFPIAEGDAASGDFRFVMVLPSFTAWGEFTDAYEGSDVAKVDERWNELADCISSTIWEGLRIK